MTVHGHRSSGPFPPASQDFDDAEDYLDEYPEDYSDEYPDDYPDDYPDEYLNDYPESGEVVIPGPAYRNGGGQHADPDGDLVPDESPIQLRRELRRRLGGPSPAGARHDPGVGRPGGASARSNGASSLSGLPGSTGERGRAGQPVGPGQPGHAEHARAAVPPELPGLAPPTTQGGAAPARPPVGGGRHARQDGSPRRPRLDYVPRHAIRTPGPSSVSPTDVTEVFSRVRQDPTERPRPARPESEPVQPPQRVQPLAGPTTEPPASPAEEQKPTETAPSGKRERVVLSQRKGTTRPVRTVVDVQELTQVGEVLSTSLIRSQLALALRVGGIALISLGSLPAMFVIFPVLGRFELFGLRLPWLLLGVLAYPFMVALAWIYSRSAERLEQVFADHIQS